MKERPILFSTPMVEALLDGRKTQTRRVIELPKGFDQIIAIRNWPLFSMVLAESVDCLQTKGIQSKYKVGDLLWVRETTRIGDTINIDACDHTIIEWTDGSKNVFREIGGVPFFIKKHVNRVTVPLGHVKWTPSIHVPKKYSRIWLRCTGVRAERVQDISYADAEAEGIKRYDLMDEHMDVVDTVYKDYLGGKGDNVFTATESFRTLWDSINGKPRKDGKDISWEANPWVWAYEFEELSRTGKPEL